MTIDEDPSAHSEHVVEIPNETPATRSARRRSFATVSVAVCLGLAGVVTAFAFMRDQSENAADRERDAVQREQLVDGWTTLGAVAAAQRAADVMAVPSATTQSNATAPAAPSAARATQAAPPVQNVIVVGSPAGAAVPQQIQSLPTQAAAVPANVSAPSANTSSAAPNAPSDLPAMQAPATATPDQATPGTPTSPPPGSPDTVLSPVTYPASQSCGLSTCNVDSVCCNVSCGTCAAPGESCSQKACG